MRDRALYPHEHTIKYVYPYWIYGLIACVFKKIQVVGWGKPNLICNVNKKMFKIILKDGMTR
jgi:hypothetical protein